MNTQPGGIDRPTISEVLQDFRDEQRARLKPGTYRNYEDVTDLLEIYINDYGPSYLSKRQKARYDALSRRGLDYCDIYGPEEILSHVRTFLSYFLASKVLASKSLLRAAGTVTKKLSRWLEEKGYTTDEEAERTVEAGAEAGRSLPRAEELANLLYDLAQSGPPGKVLETQDGYFTITQVEPGRLWLSGMLPATDEFGPVAVPREISDLAEEGWQVNLLVGRTRQGWRILEVGNVYPL